MRHLWTTVTTEQTVTHDEGGPEWLDLPLDDFVLPRTPDDEELPTLYGLDPPWQLRSKWMIDEGDIGYLLVPLVEFRDPLGVTLFQEEATLENSEDLQLPMSLTAESYMVSLRIPDMWYTLSGLYTFSVRWVGSPATRETGRFSLLVEE